MDVLNEKASTIIEIIREFIKGEIIIIMTDDWFTYQKAMNYPFIGLEHNFVNKSLNFVDKENRSILAQNSEGFFLG